MLSLLVVSKFLLSGLLGVSLTLLYNQEMDVAHFNSSSQQIVYVGDAVFDILAGKAVGMRTVGVTWGAGKREELVEAGADWVVEGMGELPI
jgi:phosphoglycolate phosphatase-like HAD superfamily hydrolase